MEENFVKLNDLLVSFCACTNVPVTIYRPSGEIVMSFLPEKNFCTLFRDQDGYRNKRCRDIIFFSTEFSASIGEPYIFTCPSNFIKIVIPIIIDKKHFASLIIGPLAMGNIDKSFLNKVFDLHPDSQALLPEIAIAISNMNTYDASHIQGLSSLLFNHVLGSFKNLQDYEELRLRNQNQILIGEKIKEYKFKTPSSSQQVISTLTSLENKIIRYIEERNKEKSHDIIKLYYEELIMIEGGNFDNIKGRIFELFGRISQHTLDNGASVQKIFNLDFNQVFTMSQIQNSDELLDWFIKVVYHFIDDVYSKLVLVQSDLIKKALIFINDSYFEKITLDDLASRLHISKTYISKLFRQEVGINFTTYLNEKRISESLEYLTEKDMSLADIALQVGFSDQSYYTKVFKKILNETPIEYRKRVIAQQ